MFKDYYGILGVPPGAAPEAIRSAFRDRAKRYHPDRSGPEGARAFREVTEAYDVLSDPVRRARFDRELCRHERVRPWIEPPLPITGDPNEVRPSLDALLERFARNFGGAARPKAERAEPLDFELILSADEARHGVRVPFEVPIFRVCGSCGGSGRDWVFPCAACSERGTWTEHEVVTVELPAGVRDGALVEVSLEDLGVRNLWLQIHVRIAAH